MPDGLPELYQTIEEALEAGDFEQARALLGSPEATDETYAVLRIKLGLREGALEPGHAMQRLIQLMRRNPEWPGAKALYQEASQHSYASGRSSASHSHVPPPPRQEDE